MCSDDRWFGDAEIGGLPRESLNVSSDWMTACDGTVICWNYRQHWHIPYRLLDHAITVSTIVMPDDLTNLATIVMPVDLTDLVITKWLQSDHDWRDLIKNKLCNSWPIVM